MKHWKKDINIWWRGQYPYWPVYKLFEWVIKAIRSILLHFTQLAVWMVPASCKSRRSQVLFASKAKMLMRIINYAVTAPSSEVGGIVIIWTIITIAWAPTVIVRISGFSTVSCWGLCCLGYASLAWQILRWGLARNFFDKSTDHL